MQPSPTTPTTQTHNHEWGHYAPDGRTAFYRMLTRIGLGRGRVARWLRGCWEKQHDYVDCTIRGVRYRLSIRQNTTDSKILTSSCTYDAAELSALREIASDSKTPGPTVFVDIGANTGYYSLSLASDFERVIAIEANPVTQALLSYNVSLNETQSRITICPVCVGEEGTVPFYCSGGLGNASVLKGRHDQQPVMVRSEPLHQILTSAGVDHVTAIKIDVEGYEDRVLIPFFVPSNQHLWPRLIVIEDCNRQDWVTDVIPFLLKVGYTEIARTRGNRILRRVPTV